MMNWILIIDDDSVFRKMLNLMLNKAGYQVLEASNGREGLELYKKEHVDLVVTDVFMPEMEGIETTMELKEINPDVKIIAISGGGSHGNFEYLSHLKNFGVHKIFTKPFASKAFLSAVKELIESRL